MTIKIKWPNNKKFAFTICDDTDFATIKNIEPIYDFLFDLGMRTTKLVWVYRGNKNSLNIGETCEDIDYRHFLLNLQNKGFEISLHNVAASTSERKSIGKGLKQFKKIFGNFPKIHCNHTGCLDNIYWDKYRLTGWRRLLFKLVIPKRSISSYGHIPGHEYFWGDLCREHITYVRNFTFDEINTLKLCPEMPYHDANKPYVNFWFAATNGSAPKYFKKNFTIPRIDRLIEDGGLCIVYSHFGANFMVDNKIDTHFRKIMEYIGYKEGWFVPVSDVLDYLRKGANREKRRITAVKLLTLELRWMFDKYGKKRGI